jgi:predicted nucleic acid-binding protein
VIVADSDVLIDWLHRKGSAPAVRRALELGDLATTAISAYQLWAGARSEKAGDDVRDLLSLMKAVLPFDDRAAELAGAAYRDLSSDGRVIGKADLYVAGVCLAVDAPLLTRNRREFERVRGLRLA